MRPASGNDVLVKVVDTARPMVPDPVWAAVGGQLAAIVGLAVIVPHRDADLAAAIRAPVVEGHDQGIPVPEVLGRNLDAHPQASTPDLERSGDGEAVARSRWAGDNVPAREFLRQESILEVEAEDRNRSIGDLVRDLGRTLSGRAG